MSRRRSFGHVRIVGSGRWHASYLDENTRQRINAPTTFGTNARQPCGSSNVETDRTRGELLDPRLSQRTFEDWSREWFAGLHVKPKTQLAYESSLRNHVLPVFSNRTVSSITYRDCRQFVDGLLAKGYAPGTVGEARENPAPHPPRSAEKRRDPTQSGRRPARARGERQEMMFLTHDEVLALAARDHQSAKTSWRRREPAHVPPIWPPRAPRRVDRHARR